jgi:hypothetical protein
MFMANHVSGNASILPVNTPAAMANHQFLAEAAQLNLEIDPKSGEELQQLVCDLLDAPPNTLRLVSSAIRLKCAEAIKNTKSDAERCAPLHL